jgi:hypothetical protein
MLLSDNELIEMVSLAKVNKVDLVLSIGPRATYVQVISVDPGRKRMGLRLRGQEQISLEQYKGCKKSRIIWMKIIFVV